MKLVLLSVALIGVAVAEDSPYPPSGSRPQGPLLVLPSQALGRQYGPPLLQQQQFDSPRVEASISLDRLSEVITERLRQQEGAQTGNYRVYLPDGRLQSVQYTSAPLRVSPSQNNQQVNVQNSQSFANSNTLQFNQQNAQANSKFQGYTQQSPNNFEESRPIGQFRQPIPAEKYSQQSANGAYSQQAISSQYRQPAAEFNQAAASNQFGQQSSRGQAGVSGRFEQPSAQSHFAQQQYSEEAASNQYNEFVAGSQNSRQSAKQVQYRPGQESPQNGKQTTTELAEDQPEGSSDSEAKRPAPSATQQGSVEQQQLYQQQVQYEQQVQVQQEQWPATYLASVHFTDVQPIPAPIYSYASAPLVRILRYAPKYQ